MQVDFAAQLAGLRERAAFVRLAIQERIQRLGVSEDRRVGVEFARRRGDDGLAEGSWGSGADEVRSF